MIMLPTHLTQYNVRVQLCNSSAAEDSSLLWCDTLVRGVELLMFQRHYSHSKQHQEICIPLTVSHTTWCESSTLYNLHGQNSIME